MSLFQKEQSYLGVDIGAGGMKLVELRKAKGRPQLWTYGIVEEAMDIHPIGVPEKTAQELSEEHQGSPTKKPQPSSPIDLGDPRIDRYAGFLKDLVRATHVSSRVVTASLPVSHIFHAVVTLPTVEEKDVDFHVLAKVKKMLPRPIEEMQVLHQVIPREALSTSSKDIKVLVTAAPRDLVAFYTAIFQRAGLKLRDLETEAFAIERSLVGRDTATVMVVDMGAERTNFFIMDHGLPITHRTIQIGGNDIDALLQKSLGASADMVGQIKKDMGSLPANELKQDMFMNALDPVINEIQYSFELFLGQSGNEGKKPEKIILTGGAALFPPVLSGVAAATGMKVFVGDPWARVVYQEGLKQVLDTIAPRMSVAIGLALRNVLS